jgi:hypothetical protein
MGSSAVQRPLAFRSRAVLRNPISKTVTSNRYGDRLTRTAHAGSRYRWPLLAVPSFRRVPPLAREI